MTAYYSSSDNIYPIYPVLRGFVLYEIVEHLPHEVNKDGVVLPFFDVVFKEHFLLLLSQVWEYYLLHVSDECLLEVLVEISSLVQLVAEFEHYSIEMVRGIFLTYE
jgi:hypothetical protein